MIGYWIRRKLRLTPYIVLHRGALWHVIRTSDKRLVTKKANKYAAMNYCWALNMGMIRTPWSMG